MNQKTETASAGIVNAITSRFPLLYVASWEEERLEKILQIISRNHYQDDRPVVQWTVAQGFFSEKGTIINLTDPQQALQYIMESENDAIYLMKDLPACFENDHALVRKLRDLYDHISGRNSTIVLSYPVIRIPEDLKKEIVLVELKLPSGDEIFRHLARLCKIMSAVTEVPREWLYRCSEAMRGMSLNEVKHLFNFLVHEQLFEIEPALQEIYKIKGQILLKESCLKIMPERNSIDSIGGLDRVKQWVDARQKLFTSKARESGVPLPSGVLFMGISGCGKSLAAKTIASAWNLQLVRLDMNLIMSGAFGSPETAFERVTTVAESIAPVVIWIDEVENSFGYDNDSVSGGNVNIFASFLTWMQEKPSTVFVVATANRIARLPAEMIRKGRFDQVFFLDLPHATERQEIFRIHILRNHGSPEQFNFATLAKLTRGWTGAEIEQAINAARVQAFTKDKQFSESEVLQSISTTVPLSETMDEQLNQLRKWSINRATPASSRARSDLG